MRRRVLVALGAALLWLPVADNLPAAQPPGADWSRPNSIQAGDITVYYPRAWMAPWRRARSSSAQAARASCSSTTGPRRPVTSRRGPIASTLDDDDRRFLSCVGFEGWNVIFTDRGQAVQALVKLGSGTPKSDAAEVLDRVEIG